MAKLNLQKQQRSLKKSLCLFSDFDDTYLLKYWPSEQILEKFSQKYTDTILSHDPSFYQTSLVLKEFLDVNHIPLIIISGRDHWQLLELVKSYKQHLDYGQEIMDFDGFIGAVSTEIYIKSKNHYLKDTTYSRLLRDTSFSRPVIYHLLKNLIPLIKNKYHPISFDFCKRDQSNSVGELPKLPYKISYEFKADMATAELIETEIKECLQKQGYGNLKILVSSPYSLSGDCRKYNVDIVPISKDQPICYLKKQLNVTSVVAGDSGNDFDMLAKAADIGIVVGNAKPELLSRLSQLPQLRQKKLVFSPRNSIGPTAILQALKTINFTYDRH